MKMRESFRDALRRLGEVRLPGTTMWQGLKPLSDLTAGAAALKRRTTRTGGATGTAEAAPFQTLKRTGRAGLKAGANQTIEAGAESARRTVPLPSILTPGAPTLLRAGVMPKPSPANLRRFAETPIARKAINTIKDRIAGMHWRIQPRHGKSPDELPAAVERIATLSENFEQPNPEDSFRSLIEQVLEDVLVGGFGSIELDLTGDAARPLTLWPVDGASIRIRTDWDGSPRSPRYVQSTGRLLADSEITLADEELSYIRLNPRTHTPFGLGKLEVAFETIHEFLSAHRYAARMGATRWCSTHCGCRT